MILLWEIITCRELVIARLAYIADELTAFGRPVVPDVNARNAQIESDPFCGFQEHRGPRVKAKGLDAPCL
jgi:hypothetical protein